MEPVFFLSKKLVRNPFRSSAAFSPSDTFSFFVLFHFTFLFLKQADGKLCSWGTLAWQGVTKPVCEIAEIDV